MAAYYQPLYPFSLWPTPFRDEFFSDIFDGTLVRRASPIPGTTQGPAAQPKLPPASSEDALFEKAAPFILAREGCPRHPYCPGDTSGVTIGVGWDASQQTQEALDSDWIALPEKDRAELSAAIGKAKIGDVARALVVTMKGIEIPKDVAMVVLRKSSIPKYYVKTQTAFPGVDFLPDPVQIALLSLVYNRGEALINKKGQTGAGLDAAAKKTGHLDRRYEMRRIRDAVARKDIQDIANQLRLMERLWPGKQGKGLVNRRELEAALVESALPHKPGAGSNI